MTAAPRLNRSIAPTHLRLDETVQATGTVFQVFSMTRVGIEACDRPQNKSYQFISRLVITAIVGVFGSPLVSEWVWSRVTYVVPAGTRSPARTM